MAAHAKSSTCNSSLLMRRVNAIRQSKNYSRFLKILMENTKVNNRKTKFSFSFFGTYVDLCKGRLEHKGIPLSSSFSSSSSRAALRLTLVLENVFVLALRG